jgi:hypothetical protein
MKYDKNYRPIFAFNSKGEQFNRTYSGDGSSITEIKDAEGVITKITDTANGMERIYETLDQPVIREMYDKAGRLSSIHAGDEILLSQNWYPDGRMESVEIENCITSPQYDEYGLIKSIIKFPEDSGNQLEEWHKTEYDLLERPVKITDFTGLNVNVLYNKSGEISQLITEREGKNFGYTFFRNDEGLIKEVKSSWGNEQYLYDSEGNILSLNIEKSIANKPEKAEYEFNLGKLKHILQFDGGEMEISYKNENNLIDLPSQVKCPNGLVLDYFYNDSGKIENVGIGRNRTINLEYDDKERVVSFCFIKN